MIVVIHGKVVENIGKRINLELIDKTDTRGIKNTQLNVTFHDQTTEYENFHLFSFSKGNVSFTKPILVGFCVF